jgi:nucleoside-diphosphate-sugar epimerase
MRGPVTGHDGYIGVVLVPLLQGAGHDVVGLDTELYWAYRVAGFERGDLAAQREEKRGLQEILAV